MAKKRIKKEDIAPKDIFANITEGAAKAKVQIEALKTAVNALKQSAKGIKKDIGKQKTGDTKGLKDFDVAQKKANQTAKAKLKIDKQLLYQQAALRKHQGDINNKIKTEIGLRKAEVGSLNQVRAQSKKLILEKNSLNLQTKKGTQRLKEINTQLNRNNKILDKNATKLGKQKNNIGNYGSAVGKLTGMLGKLGLGFGVFSLIRNAFNVVKDFEQSQANLASVLGVTTEGMKGLTNQAQELGATTTFTASQVAELQLEFAKLGFTQEQIEGMSEATLALAEATGTELGEAASVVGATMRGFGMDVNETQRVVDVMANSFSKSSLDMSKFSTSMAAVAPVAKLAGLNIEQTTALLGTLTDRGIEASTAGTGLRNMFLQANKHGLTFNEALGQIENASDQTGAALKLFGTRGATLGVILANNKEGVADLTKELYASDGAAQKMADTQRNTLGGSIKLLTSAWEGWILKQNEAGGASEQLREIIDFLSKNIETILGWVMFAVKQFVLFKGAMIATRLATMAFNATALLTQKSMKGLVIATKKMDKGMKSSGIGLLVSLLVQLVYWVYEAVTAESELETATRERKEEAEAARKEVEREQDVYREGISTFEATIEVLKRTNAGSKERSKLIKQINDKYGTTLKNLKNEAKFQQQINIQVDAYIKLQKSRFLAAKNAKALTAQLTLQVEAEEKILELKIAIEKVKKTGETTAEAKKRLKTYTAVMKDGVVTMDQTGTEKAARNAFATINEWRKQLRLSTAEIDRLGAIGVDIAAELFDPGTLDLTDTGDLTTSTTVEKQISLIRQIEDAQIKLIDDEQERENLAAAAKYERLVKDTRAQKTNKAELAIWEIEQNNLLVAELQKIDDKFESEKKIVRQKNELAIIQSAILEKQTELKKTADIFENFKETESLRSEIDEKQIEFLKKKAEFDVDNSKLGEDEKKKIISASLLKIEEIKLAAINRGLKHEEEARKILSAEYKKAEDEKLLELLNSSDDQKTVSKKLLKFQIEQLDELIVYYKKNYPLLKEEILAMEIESAKMKRQFNQEDVDGAATTAKEIADIKEAALQATTDFFIKQVDERIKEINRESDAAIKQADLYRQLAANGNITAKESLAEQNKIIQQSEAEKARLEKRKQQILMVSSILLAYNKNLENNEKNPLAKALASKVVLDQFIAGIGTFFDGTEDTGTVSNALDSNGGRMAVLHNNERVMTAKQNSMIGSVSNNEVARVMENHRLGKLVGNNEGATWDNQLIVDELMSVGNKLDKMNSTIANKETNKIELGDITQSTMKIMETRQKGLKRTISTYKIR